MTFWPDVCYCPYCTERFRKEHGAEPPRIVNWDDPIWRMFQKARQQWMLEFAMLVTKTIKEVRPITVNHQYSTDLSRLEGRRSFGTSGMLATMLAGTSMAAPRSIRWPARPFMD